MHARRALRFQNVTVCRRHVAGRQCPGGRSAAGEKGLEIDGFAQAEFIQDFKRVNPDWDHSLCPSCIPTTKGQCGGDEPSIVGVCQSRFDVKGNLPVGGKALNTQCHRLQQRRGRQPGGAGK
jgi:hypothetical protein